MQMPLRVQNGPVPHRRELKAASRMILVLGVAGAVAFSLILATWQHVEALRYGYRLNQLMRERERLEALKRQLESERAYYRSPQVIEPLARRLGLIRPDPSQVIVVGRGGSSPQANDPRVLLSGGFERASGAHDLAPGTSTPRSGSSVESARAVRRRLRAKPVKPVAEIVGEESPSSSGSPGGMPIASETSENANASSSKGIRSDEGAVVERPSDSTVENPTSKRRRPSKQGEP
ncbi:MAG: cell division protein FtsL [Blastocatellia bacterium]|nr:cell division protein FtsL [Blastocatellia bacterium]MCX7752229.1 cell division protein FtsL [Blastocatellia bacterium]MDW8167721.1 hypothetical protein [Acidobacteriota bacterium]